MSENENTVDPAVDDLDDVEAHGMREVAVGLSAAAVLTGGAAAVINSQGSGDGGSRSIQATHAIDAEKRGVTTDTSAASGGGAVGGPASITPAGGASESLAQGGVDAATSAVQGTADTADDVVSPNRTFMGRVDDRVDATVDQARDVRDNAVAYAEDTADAARATIKEEVRDAGAAVRQAPQTVRTAVEDLASGTVTTPNVRDVAQSARKTVDATLVLVGDTVRGITDGAMTTIARVQPGVGSDVDVKDASGWVTVTVGGEEVAKAEVKDGQASVTWQAPSGDAPAVFTYSGNDVLNATSVTL